VIEDASKVAVRDGERRTAEAQKKAAVDQLDRQQAALKKALELAQGKIPAFQGGANPYPASEALAELRKAKIDLYFAPVLDAQGKPVADQFVQLKDSYSDKVVILSRKMAEKKASKKEIRFIQKGAKYVVKLNDLKGQVRAATTPAIQAGWMVTSGSMTTMQTVAQMIKIRRQFEMSWTDEDYEIVRELLVVQSQRESIAAVSIGLLASYQAIIGGGGDPKLLDTLLKGTLEALPLKGKATLEDAKTTVTNFEANVDAAHQLYEAQMRKTWGDAQYEAKYKAQIDSTFAQMKGASSTKSVTQMMDDTQIKYVADLQKCARGEKPDGGSMVGPAKCKEARAQAGSGGFLTQAALDLLAGGTAKAEAAAKEGLGSLVDMIPGVTAVKQALEGVKALRDGDVAKALRIAADLVPIPGPAKAALSAVAKIVEAVAPIDMKGRPAGA